MTPNQLSALEWLIAEVRPIASTIPKEIWNAEMPALLALIEETKESHRREAAAAKSALRSRDIPLKEDHRRIDAKLLVFMARWGITIPYKESLEWRMVDRKEQRQGMINALPESKGILRATNGILCYIERSDETLYLGHVQHWMADQPERSTGDRKPRVAKEPKALVKKKTSFNMLLEELDFIP